MLDVGEPGEVSTSLFDGDLRTDLPAYRDLRARRAGRRGARRPRALARRPRGVPDRLQLHLRARAARGRCPGAPPRGGHQRADVPHLGATTRPAGSLHGPLVVSMRPVPADLVATAVRVTSRYPAVHGAPVHVGDPRRLGITDLDAPDFGDRWRSGDGEVPVFWACGVTPQAAVMASRPDVRDRPRAGPHGGHRRAGLRLRRPVTGGVRRPAIIWRVTPGEWSADRRARRRVARAQLAARRDLGRGVHQLRGLRPGRDRPVGVPVRRRDGARDPARADRAQPRHLARRAARDPAGPALRVPRRRAVGPDRACGSTRTSCCSTPTPAR